MSEDYYIKILHVIITLRFILSIKAKAQVRAKHQIQLQVLHFT